METEPRSCEPSGEDAPRKSGMPGSGVGRSWWRPPSWVRSELLHEWIRSGGILIAAAWGMYTFIWKDMLVPAWQPAHLTLEASLTPVPNRPSTAAGLEMTLAVKATNASSRPVYPLANIWWLRGLQRDPRQGTPAAMDQQFRQDSNRALLGDAPEQVERGVSQVPRQLLAVGRLFNDDVVQAGDSISRTILVRIPNGYAAAELTLIVPLLTRKDDGLFNGRRLAWGLNPDDEPIPLVCPVPIRDESNPTRLCQPVDGATDLEMQRFDPKKSTITLSQQIGLPVNGD